MICICMIIYNIAYAYVNQAVHGDIMRNNQQKFGCMSLSPNAVYSPNLEI